MKEFYKAEFIRNITDHEIELRIIYADDIDIYISETGDPIYLCRFSNGSKLPISTNLYDDFHITTLKRMEKDPV